MGETRTLVVNADDLGLSAAVNGGIFTAHAEGIVTSTSLMVCRAAAPAAAEALGDHPDLAVGLHLEAGEDLRRQLESFRELVGCDPTHLDSHKHLHEIDAGSARAPRLSPPSSGCRCATGGSATRAASTAGRRSRRST